MPVVRAILTAAAFVAAATAARADQAPTPGETMDLRSRVPGNPFAYIPPQCYTRTVDDAGDVHNPCYACHVAAAAPNHAGGEELQLAYDFPGPALENRWSNLFVDRMSAIAGMPDADTLRYVREDNYHAADGTPELARRLAAPPAGWDIDGDGRWSGYVPDIFFRFDEAGYDLDPDGARTGWRSYGYIPLPGAFWPSNGSADDVAIRLPEAFRQREDGTTDWGVYETNLAIVEALVKRADVPVNPTDEASLGVDLDGDGALGTTEIIRYALGPRNGVTMSYVGRARAALAAGQVHLAAGLFPEGTEFVHSLRYLDVDADGTVGPAPRLKELRHARKVGWRTYGSLQEQALNELREERDDPDRAERFFGDVESGIATGQGWRLQGFIEDAVGSLQPQSFEESLTCAGCHAGTGRTVDNVFSYTAKVDAPDAGWFHWDRDRPLGALADPRLPDGTGFYVTYLRRNGAGDEFRANLEAYIRFFDADGTPDEAAIAALEDRIGSLTDPSAARALALDKAYRLIVAEQSFDKGRNPVLQPLGAVVWDAVPPGTLTGVTEPVGRAEPIASAYGAMRR